mgnify:CR=1 FL=1
MNKKFWVGMFLSTVLLLLLSNGVSAAVNSSYITVGSPTTYSFSSSNYSTSVLLNLTFQASGTAAIDSGGDLDTSGLNITSAFGLWNLTATFYAKSSNATFTTLGKTSNCLQGRNTTEFACWMTVTLNSSLDGLWTISGNVTNATNAVNSYARVGLNASSNATGVRFDSTPPSVTFIRLNNSGRFGGANYSGILFAINVSVNDSYAGGQFDGMGKNNSVGVAFAGVFLNVTKSSGTQNTTYTMTNLTTSNGTTVIFHVNTLNTSHWGQDTYTFTIWANDSLGNLNKSESVSFVVDLTNPTITSTQLANSTQTSMSVELLLDGSYSGLNGVCTSSRSGSTVAGTTLGTGSKYQYLGESGLACNTNYSYTITCTDYAGNVGTSDFGFKTDGCSTSSSPGGSTGSTTPTWTNTVVASTSELTSEGTTQSLAVKSRVEVKVNAQKHYVGVKELTATSATIEISSLYPVSVQLNAGQDAKVDVDKDGTYDIYVKLNGIVSGKADLLIQKISEAVVGTGQVSTTGTQVSGEETPTTPETGATGGSKAWIWIVGIVIVIIAIGAGIGMKGKSNKNKKMKLMVP